MRSGVAPCDSTSRPSAATRASSGPRPSRSTRPGDRPGQPSEPSVGVTGAGAVTALVLLEWTVGWVAGAAWTQSWNVVRRGHFRVTAWCALGLGALALFATRAAFSDA